MNPPPAPAPSPSLLQSLQTHLALCEEILGIVTRENEALHTPTPFPSTEFARQRNALLPRLTRSLDSLARSRAARGTQPAPARAAGPDAETLMQRNQELIMRILVLDRENEQALLRRGLLPPGHLPASQRQQPHLVAQRYLHHHLA